ncbi:MAG: DNA-3-methyladenine glycosylase I [Phycisphaerales bacterium]|nr:DNA-3-methyladenine glycosylase I [Phycisphaerales bacterium]
MTRCPWAKNDLSVAYHDAEWGVPLHDDHRLFEFVILEGAQAGLSWDTILKKRERYRDVFEGFDPRIVARFTDARLEKLLLDPGIVRNRLKVWSARDNAKAALRAQDDFGSLDALLWQFVSDEAIEAGRKFRASPGGAAGRPIQGKRRTLKDIPASTAPSDAMSADLKKRGFRFVGTTICYALMQAVGMANDHLIGCPRCAVCARMK